MTDSPIVGRSSVIGLLVPICADVPQAPSVLAHICHTRVYLLLCVTGRSRSRGLVDAVYAFCVGLYVSIVYAPDEVRVATSKYALDVTTCSIFDTLKLSAGLGKVVSVNT